MRDIGLGVSLSLAILTVLPFFLSPAEYKEICFKNNCFAVEIADSREEHLTGLMYRKNLPSDKGMFFIFKKMGNYSFWMRNTYIGLDIIWINEDYEVVYIAKNQTPCYIDPCQSVSPDKEAKYVLEINSGKSDKIGLSVGDKLDFAQS